MHLSVLRIAHREQVFKASKEALQKARAKMAQLATALFEADTEHENAKKRIQSLTASIVKRSVDHKADNESPETKQKPVAARRRTTTAV